MLSLPTDVRGMGEQQHGHAAHGDPMIHPGDTVTLVTSWDAVRVDEALADWLVLNPWAVRYHWPRGQCRPVHSR